MKKTKVPAIKCRNCGDTVFSRARHDFRSCSCGKVSIDGGFSGYTKVCGNADDFEYTSVTLDKSEADLFSDWNKRVDKYGIIKDVADGNSGVKKQRRY